MEMIVEVRYFRSGTEGLDLIIRDRITKELFTKKPSLKVISYPFSFDFINYRNEDDYVENGYIYTRDEYSIEAYQISLTKLYSSECRTDIQNYMKIQDIDQQIAGFLWLQILEKHGERIIPVALREKNETVEPQIESESTIDLIIEDDPDIEYETLI
jgi:hypothetical protein